jgi:hypothetical protein
MFSLWSDKYGMINPDRGKRSENGILFTLEAFLLGILLSGRGSTFNYYSKRFVDLCDLWLADDNLPGYFYQTPFGMLDSEGRLEPTSHDNLTAIVAGSYFFGDLDTVKSVWKYLVSHYFTYDVTVNFKRIMHPRDVVLYGAMAGSIICKLLLPLVVLSNIISCSKEPGVTSGKLLAWVRNTCYFDSWVMKVGHVINTWQINRQYENGWVDVFKVYFPQEGHPVPKFAELVANKGVEL